MSDISFITMDDVVRIHDLLVLDAANSEDPISPPGIKNEGLLLSAISRQEAGFGGRLKYDTPISNAATLCYGICCNHPLHNGNKRTALVALMCHLDRNGITFSSRTSQDNLYSFMLNVAAHKLVPKKKRGRVSDISDLEVTAMHDWIRKRSRKIEKGERSLSYPELERVLRSHKIYFENHKNNYVDLVRRTTKTERRGFFGRKVEVNVVEKIANIPYWPGRTVGKNLVKSIRKQASLTHNNGIDSALFYGSETLPDDFIQKNKKVLYKLAKT